MLCATNPSPKPDTLLSSHHRSVAFAVTSWQCCLCCRVVAVLPLPSCCGSVAFAIALWRCCHRHCIVPVRVLPLPLCRHRVTFAIASLQGCLCCCVIAVLTSLSQCHSVAFAIVSSWCHLCHRVILSFVTIQTA